MELYLPKRMSESPATKTVQHSEVECSTLEFEATGSNGGASESFAHLGDIWEKNTAGREPILLHLLLQGVRYRSTTATGGGVEFEVYQNSQNVHDHKG